MGWFLKAFLRTGVPSSQKKVITSQHQSLPFSLTKKYILTFDLLLCNFSHDFFINFFCSCTLFLHLHRSLTPMTRIFANFQLPHKFLLLKNSYRKRVSSLKHAYSCKIAPNKTQISISNKYLICQLSFIKLVCLLKKLAPLYQNIFSQFWLE